MLRSCLCKASHFNKKFFDPIAFEIREAKKLHRKLWEYVMVLQALKERGMIAEGKKGLGFAVGQEPLPAYLAKYGCEILATDISPEDKRSKAWGKTGQLLTSLNVLNERGICDPKRFKKLVKYKAVDMNKIPKNLKNFDFTWSDCSFEHLGSIRNGIDFMLNQMECLKPGGWAVHTTEINLSSKVYTLDSGATVLFRKIDILEIIQKLKEKGHRVERMNWSLGISKNDRYVDKAPYHASPHLKLELGGYTTTSIMLIVEKGF